jgi:leucyl aminopeptidase
MAKANWLVTSTTRKQKIIPVLAVQPKNLAQKLAKFSPAQKKWVAANDFNANPGQYLLLPDAQGQTEAVLFGMGETSDPFLPGKLAKLLPAGIYNFEGFKDARLAALGFLLEAYVFDAYKKQPLPTARILCPNGVNARELLSIAQSVHHTRDLVNLPAADLGPDELEADALALAKAHRGKAIVTRGAKLEREFPMIHTVGRASSRPPRLIDMSFGKANAPRITLVGKGVCFDTGGLDIKPSSGMLLMKKDMGGAANVLGLARMILEAHLPVRLRVLIPAVENSIAGNAFRPGDVLKSRKGLNVEIGNTDAEGRLVLADALALADDEKPELLITMATLTGAARVALGPDLPAFYTDDEDLAVDLAKKAHLENDPFWRLPFWDPYNRMIESRVADINNAGEGGFAGSITAALFLKRFVSQARSFAHIDMFAWTPAARPGRPYGGEAQVIRALFALLKARYPA